MFGGVPSASAAVSDSQPPLSETHVPTPEPSGSLIEHDGCVGIAFGGGGVRGWAHVGALSVVERYGFRFGCVAGTSAGAITASFLASGFSVPEMREVMQAQRTRSLFALRFDRLALVNSDAFEAWLRRYLGERRIEDLPIPLSIVCTDLESGKEVILDRGPLVSAVMASCALPGIFVPVEHSGRLLVDGGLCDNVPVSALVHRGATFTIGVQLYKRIGALTPLGDGTLDAPDDDLEEKVGLGMWLDRVRQRLGRDAEPAPKRLPTPNGLEVVQRSLDILMARLEGYRLQAYPPDVLIVPRTRTAGMLSLGQEKESIYQAGVEAAERRAEELEALAARVRLRQT